MGVLCEKELPFFHFLGMEDNGRRVMVMMVSGKKKNCLQLQHPIDIVDEQKEERESSSD